MSVSMEERQPEKPEKPVKAPGGLTRCANGFFRAKNVADAVMISACTMLPLLPLYPSREFGLLSLGVTSLGTAMSGVVNLGCIVLSALDVIEAVNSSFAEDLEDLLSGEFNKAAVWCWGNTFLSSMGFIAAPLLAINSVAETVVKPGNSDGPVGLAASWLIAAGAFWLGGRAIKEHRKLDELAANPPEPPQDGPEIG
jgi:hypothetical protein